MPKTLNYNLLLGRPWLHNMHDFPSTLNWKVKFIYNNLVYTLMADNKPNSCFNVEPCNKSMSIEEK